MRTNAGAAIRTLLAIAIAVALATLTFAVSGYPAGGIFSGIANGAITGPGAWQNTVRWAVPLALMGTGTVVSFRAGFYNVGAQGQFYLGAIATFAVADHVPGGGWVAIIAAVAAGTLAGVVWAGIAAVLRVVFGTDETLSTLMLNFIATLLLQYMVNGPLKDISGSAQASQSSLLPANTRISTASGVSATILIVTLAALAAMWLIVNRTRFGLVATLAGRNPEMVRWQGGKSSSLSILAFVYSGALAGLAGALDILGPDGQLFNGFAPSVGFTAVTVALVGILTVSGAVIAGIFFGALVAAIQFLPITTNLPPSAFDLLQALITTLVTAQLGVRLRTKRRRARPPTAVARGASEHQPPGDPRAVSA